MRENESEKKKRHKVSIIKIQALLPVATWSEHGEKRYVYVSIFTILFREHERDLLFDDFSYKRSSFLILGSRLQWRWEESCNFLIAHRTILINMLVFSQ